MIWLKYCSFGVKQQPLTHSFTQTDRQSNSSKNILLKNKSVQHKLQQKKPTRSDG
jgi:hypothetical protein